MVHLFEWCEVNKKPSWAAQGKTSLINADEGYKNIFLCFKLKRLNIKSWKSQNTAFLKFRDVQVKLVTTCIVCECTECTMKSVKYSASIKSLAVPDSKNWALQIHER